MGSLSQTRGEITKMKLVPSLVLLLVGLVLLAVVGEISGGPQGIRRQGTRPLRQRITEGTSPLRQRIRQGMGPRAQRIRQGTMPLRQMIRQGRQEEVEGGEQAALDEAAALPNGCDPKSPIGAFLLFRGVKVWCGSQGVNDFGPYGALPAEETEE